MCLYIIYNESYAEISKLIIINKKEVTDISHRFTKQSAIVQLPRTSSWSYIKD